VLSVEVRHLGAAVAASVLSVPILDQPPSDPALHELRVMDGPDRLVEFFDENVISDSILQGSEEVW